MSLQQLYSLFFAGFERFLIPIRGLNLTDMRSAEKKLAKAALSYTAANRERYFICENRLVVRERKTFLFDT